MASININTANQIFRQLLGNGLTYHVPRFQRGYSWTSCRSSTLDGQTSNGDLAHCSVGLTYYVSKISFSGIPASIKAATFNA